MCQNYIQPNILYEQVQSAIPCDYPILLQLSKKRIETGTEYTEFQAFNPVVLNWVPPPPHLQESVAPYPPFFGSNGGGTLACGEGVGRPNSDDGTDILVL